MTDFQYVGEELDLFSDALNWKAYFADLLQPYIRGRVLEVGAGLGATTAALWNSSVESWLCLEPDPALAAQLERRFAGASYTPQLIIGTVDDLKGTDRFDCILYIDVLEHIRDDRDELRRSCRHLKPGGNIVVLSPAFQSLYSPFDKALGHERRYTAKSLAAVFPDGLERRKVFYADSAGALLSFANRLLLRQELPNRKQIRVWDRGVIPISRRFLDPIARRWFGRSVIAVYSRQGS